MRVDIVNPADPNLIANPLDVSTSVLENIFQTTPDLADTVVPSQVVVTDTPIHLSMVAGPVSGFSLEQFVGQTIELRIAATNNQGLLIVGVDNVRITVDYDDNTAPKVTSINLRNPSYLSGPNTTEQSTDQTIIGTITDAGSVNNLSTVKFDFTNQGFANFHTGVDSVFDAYGNFVFTPQNTLAPGTYTVPYLITDRGGNTVTGTFSFIIQSPSLVTWEAQGPEQTDVSSASVIGVQYTTVSGQVTATVLDPKDPSGNTFYVGSDNGGIWKTTDGGNDYTPLTDDVTLNGQGVPVPIASIAVAVDPNQPSLEYVYAATGVAFNDATARSSVGILYSSNGGESWQVLGTNFFAGAHISKLVLDPTTVGVNQIIYVSVAWWDDGAVPGIWKSTNNGLTWANVMTEGVNMYLPTNIPGTNGNPLGTPFGTTAKQITSVTDMIIDPFNPNRLIVGLGDVGHGTSTVLPTDATTAGVWLSTDKGKTWVLQVGGDNLAVGNGTGNNILPSGNAGDALGRITLAQGTGRVGDERYVYVLIANPPAGSSEADPFNQGTEFGLYRSKDNMSNFTKVQLLQQTGPTSFAAINLLAEQGSNYGSMVVDPSDPAVVYIGGSDELPYSNLLQAADLYNQHSVVRVDTGDMRDSTYIDPLTGVIPNDGDDIQKAEEAERNWLYSNGLPLFPTVPPSDPPTAANPFGAANYRPTDYPARDLGPAYAGEGVYWYDIQEGGDNQSNLLNPSLSPSSANNIRIQNMPGSVDSITIDPKGRVLFGTSEGLYRGLDRGFGYDFTTGNGNYSGGSGGILADDGVATYAAPLGMDLTQLNGDLQIADLTSVAIDPTASGVYYTSETQTGSAVTTSGVNGWQTMGLVGPTIDTTPSNVQFNTPNGYQVIASYTDGVLNANPQILAPAGEETTIYRVWEKNNTGPPYDDYPTFSSLLVEVSHDGGLSFSPVDPNGISVNDTAGIAPILALNPQKTLVNGIYYDQLMFGTDRVYLTNTQGNIWDYQSPVLDPTVADNNISALAFAGGNTPVYYAALEDGEIFYHAKPNGPWVNEGTPGTPPTGLPVGNISSLTVNPNHPNIVYATFSVIPGAGPNAAYVYESINNGKTWHRLTGSVAGETLPNVQTYAFVYGPSGRLYVGTNNGVFTSTDGGTTWSDPYLGLPNAPVVSLQYNANLNVLAAALQGRGVFTLSTCTTGPGVVNSNTTPSTASTSPAGSVQLTYNEPVQPSTFNTSGEANARAAVVDSMLASPTYLQVRLQQLYAEFHLSFSTATASAIQSYEKMLNAPNGETAVTVALLGSTIYYQTVGGNNNASWLNQVYEDLLGRGTAGDVQANLYLQEMNKLGTLPATILTDITAGTSSVTTEFQSDQIARLANLYGGSAYNYPIPAPESDAFISTWVTNFSQGMSVRNLVETLLDSNSTYESLNNLYTTPSTGRTVVALGDFTGSTLSAAISSVGGSANAPIIITSPTTNLVSGQTVTISGVVGYPAANGSFTITILDSDDFSLRNTSATGMVVPQTAAFWTADPSGAIASISGAPSSPIVITSPNNNLATGQSVTISGVSGFNAANGTFTITVIDANDFSLNNTSGPGTLIPQTAASWSYNPTLDLAVVQTNGNASTAAISSVGGSSGSPIVIESPTTGLSTGQLVTISGAINYASANGTFTITIVDATHFSLNGTAATGSTCAPNRCFLDFVRQPEQLYRDLSGHRGWRLQHDSSRLGTALAPWCQPESNSRR